MIRKTFKNTKNLFFKNISANSKFGHLLKAQPQSCKELFKISELYVIIEYFYQYSSRLLSLAWGNQAFWNWKEPSKSPSSAFSLNRRGLRGPERGRDLPKVAGNFWLRWEQVSGFPVLCSFLSSYLALKKMIQKARGQMSTSIFY